MFKSWMVYKFHFSVNLFSHCSRCRLGAALSTDVASYVAVALNIICIHRGGTKSLIFHVTYSFDR